MTDSLVVEQKYWHHSCWGSKRCQSECKSHFGKLWQELKSW